MDFRPAGKGPRSLETDTPCPPTISPPPTASPTSAAGSTTSTPRSRCLIARAERDHRPADFGEAHRRARRGVPARPRAAMMHALVDRHRGHLPIVTVEHVWREIISTFTWLQAPYTVHVATGDAAKRGTWRGSTSASPFLRDGGGSGGRDRRRGPLVVGPCGGSPRRGGGRVVAGPSRRRRACPGSSAGCPSSTSRTAGRHARRRDRSATEGSDRGGDRRLRLPGAGGSLRPRVAEEAGRRGHRLARALGRHTGAVGAELVIAVPPGIAILRPSPRGRPSAPPRTPASSWPTCARSAAMRPRSTGSPDFRSSSIRFESHERHHATRPVPRAGVLSIDAYVPGRSKAAPGKKLYKLSSNETPLGPSPKAVEAFRPPPPTSNATPRLATALREAIADVHGLTPSRIVCGNGSTNC